MNSDPFRSPEPNPRDTAEFSPEEILHRLELGRLQVHSSPEGQRVEIRHREAPAEERRQGRGSPGPEGERRHFQPLNLPLLFPESGHIGLLLVGGFADNEALRQATPFWGDDNGNATLIWQALERSGYLLSPTPLSLGRGGCWDPIPPRTVGLAMTYAGYRPRGGVADIERVLHSWNTQRLQAVVQACHGRSGGELRIVALGEVAWFMMCACVYGIPGVPVLTLPEPRLGEVPDLAKEASAAQWVDWAADLLEVGRGSVHPIE